MVLVEALSVKLITDHDINMNKGICVFDMDGTLADIEHRRHFVHQTPKDWKGFFENIASDDLRQDVYDMLIGYHMKDHPIIIVSARPEEYRTVTVEWLKKYNVPHFTLIMRRSGDKRPDTEVKKQIYDTYLKKYKIECVVDDRPSVIRQWQALGLNVIDVGNQIDF